MENYYYYQQALELLFVEKAKIKDLSDALTDLSIEYGQIYYAATNGHIQGAEPELRKLRVVIDFLKTKVRNFEKEESSMKNLNVPYFSQLNNVYHPLGTCNLTCAAMCLDYHGVRPKKKGVQLEDELFEYVYDHKLSRHSPEDIAKVIKAFGCQDKFTWKGSIAEINKSIDAGNPCIIHGMFTRSGHIIVVRGYNEQGLIVNDPYGEFFERGYDLNVSGANLIYSFGLIQRTCAYDGEFWIHSISK